MHVTFQTGHGSYFFRRASSCRGISINTSLLLVVGGARVCSSSPSLLLHTSDQNTPCQIEGSADFKQCSTKFLRSWSTGRGDGCHRTKVATLGCYEMSSRTSVPTQSKVGRPLYLNAHWLPQACDIRTCDYWPFILFSGILLNSNPQCRIYCIP